MLIQTKSDIDGSITSADKSEVLKFIASLEKKGIKTTTDKSVAKALDDMRLAEINLHMLINNIEGKAMQMGFHYATGFIGGRCLLCEECVAVGSTEKCPEPYKPRPSLEAVGIDVVQTSINAGLPFDLPPKTEIIWNGMLLVE